jgi:hypothetical protein
VSALAFLCASGVLYGAAGVFLCAVSIASATIVLWIKSRGRRIVLCLIAATCAWFLLIHRVVEDVECAVCRFRITEDRVEVFCLPVIQLRTIETPTLITLVARDLGCPCPHKDLVELKGTRADYWGLRFLVNYQSGIIGFKSDDDEWYRDNVRPLVLNFRHEHPELVTEFQTRVIEQNDHDYWVHFINDVLKIPDR